MLELIEQKKIVQEVLENLRPYVQSHGGDIMFIDLVDDKVFIKFIGNCIECPLSFYTVTYGIERHIKAKLPDIVGVEVLDA